MENVVGRTTNNPPHTHTHTHTHTERGRGRRKRHSEQVHRATRLAGRI